MQSAKRKSSARLLRNRGNQAIILGRLSHHCTFRIAVHILREHMHTSCSRLPCSNAQMTACWLAGPNCGRRSRRRSLPARGPLPLANRHMSRTCWIRPLPTHAMHALRRKSASASRLLHAHRRASKESNPATAKAFAAYTLRALKSAPFQTFHRMLHKGYALVRLTASGPGIVP